MIADHLARRMWTFDGDDRKVEVWLRHDGAWLVSRLRRRPNRPRVWDEVESAVLMSQAAAMATAQEWMLAEQVKMP